MGRATGLTRRALGKRRNNAKPLAAGTLAEFQATMKGSAVTVVPMTEGQTVGF